MTLLPMIAGLALFFAAHVFTTMRERRVAALGRLGEGGYKGLYSLVSGVGLALIIWGFGYYRAKGYIAVWEPPRWTVHVALTLMLPAFILLAAAYLPGKIREYAKHPMLAGVKLWALSHLLANGDLGSILLFGSFLAYGVFDRIAVKKRERIEGKGPAKVAMPVNDLLAVGIGGAAYVLFIYVLHPMLIGVPVFASR